MLLALKQSIRNLVAYGRQVRRREMAGEFACRDVGACDLLRPFDDVRVGDFLTAHADLDIGAVFHRERFELFKQVAAENSRMGHRRLVDALMMEPGKGAKASRARRLFVAMNEPEERIVELGAGFGRGGNACAEIGVERLRKRGSGLCV